MPILLKDIFGIDNPKTYKVHFAKWNGNRQPLDDWTKNRDDWLSWQKYRPQNNSFNRDYIFALNHFYHEKNTWLFAGIFEVVDRLPDQYVVELTDIGQQFIGRLKLESDYNNRQTRVNLENHYDTLQVKEILSKSFNGRTFPGYENIILSFSELETITQNQLLDWKYSLQSIKGVYLITDSLTGKFYVGSAYGEAGIWGRWNEYLNHGHGGNIELRELAPEKDDITYYRQNFQFSLLEFHAVKTPDNIIIQRENHWKEVLLSRQHGMNRN